MKTIPKIAMDARMVGEIPHGISRYVSYLAQSLIMRRESFGLPYEIIFLVKPEIFSKNGAFFGWPAVPVNAPFLNPLEWIEIPKTLRANEIDLFHSPSFSSYPRLPCPWISTLHDLNHLHFGSLLQKLYYRALLKPFAKKARALVTVSEFSKNEIAEWLGQNPERISIVPNVIAPPPDKPNAEQERLTLASLQIEKGHYFFSMINAKAHKNSKTLATAYRNYAAQTALPLPLLLTLSAAEHQTLPKGKGLIRCIGGVSQETAQTLLQNCAGHFFPSLYEGFGLPPVEAAVVGAPLATSSISPHQEGLIDLKGSEALWVNPNDLHGWTQAFHRIAKGEISPPQLDSRRKILERFSLEKMGQKMDQLYRSVLGLGSL